MTRRERCFYVLSLAGGLPSGIAGGLLITAVDPSSLRALYGALMIALGAGAYTRSLLGLT
jgi:hypothetical protein